MDAAKYFRNEKFSGFLPGEIFLLKIRQISEKLANKHKRTLSLILAGESFDEPVRF